MVRGTGRSRRLFFLLSLAAGVACAAHAEPPDYAPLSAALAEGGAGIEVEALIDGDSELHFTPEGLYWTHREGYAFKAGLIEGANEPTYLNGLEWWPRWGVPDDRRCDDKTELVSFAVPALDNLTFERLSVGILRGVHSSAARSPMESRLEDGEFVIAIPDKDDGPNWYKFRVYAGAPPEQAVSYEADLTAFFQEVDKTYPFFDLKHIRDDWRATKERLTEQVKECESGGAFLGIVVEAIQCLRDSHMWAQSPKYTVPPRPKEYCPGIAFMPATESRVVVMAAYGALAGELPVGTVVTKLNGNDARAYLDQQAEDAWPTSFASSKQRARLYTYRIALKGAKGDTHTITYLKDGVEHEREVVCDTEARGWAHTYNLPDRLTRSGRSFFYTQLSDGAGYMYLRRVDGSVVPGMDEALEAHPDAAGWIVDLRGNGGGGYGDDLINRVKALPGPVAVLIDAGCISAGETLARDFARYADARLFGATTGGASSSKRQWEFPSGIATVSMPTRSRWRNDGKPIEFNGIEPDQPVEAVPDEVQAGRNSCILRAQEYLKAVEPAEDDSLVTGACMAEAASP